MFNEDVLEVPIQMYVVDLPEIHKYLNHNSKELLEALAETDNIEIYNNVSIRAMIELKWPKIKNAI